jgi:hypothetical protein
VLKPDGYLITIEIEYTLYTIALFIVQLIKQEESNGNTAFERGGYRKVSRIFSMYGGYANYLKN